MGAPAQGITTNQATGESNGTWTQVSDGRYTYKFASALPAGYDTIYPQALEWLRRRLAGPFQRGRPRRLFVSRYRPVRRRFAPDPPAHAAYQPRIERFRRLYRQLKDEFARD